MKLGQTIAKLRKQNNMTQAEVAEALHISYQAVSKWERDESLPDITLLQSIAELFQVNVDKLLDTSCEMNEDESMKTYQIKDEDAQQEINQQITEIVNKEFELGMVEGKIPSADELADRISDFFISKS